jgi:hypothetical protein
MSLSIGIPLVNMTLPIFLREYFEIQQAGAKSPQIRESTTGGTLIQILNYTLAYHPIKRVTTSKIDCGS